MDTSLLAFPKPKDKNKKVETKFENKPINKLKTTKNIKVNKSINKISKKKIKQSRKDKKVYNKFVEDSYICEICKNKEAREIHHIFGGTGNRDNSTKYGFLKHLCIKCHDIIEADQKLDEKYKKEAQKKFEKKYNREKFIKIFGKSYL